MSRDGWLSVVNFIYLMARGTFPHVLGMGCAEDDKAPHIFGLRKERAPGGALEWFQRSENFLLPVMRSSMMAGASSILILFCSVVSLSLMVTVPLRSPSRVS